MKIKALLTCSLVVGLLGGCASFSGAPENADIYAQVDESDVLNERAVTFTKRVSHIVTFDYDSYELPVVAPDVVEPHVRFLIANPSYKVALQGNASNEGTRRYNFELAQKRISAVKRVFVELGIEPEQIVELPVGETQSDFVPTRSVLIVY
jgi:peptidoglycan-associated lipoprotein